LQLATTPGITLPESVEFHAYAKSEKSKKQKNGAPPPVKELLLHSTDHERMEFTAREDRPEIMNKLLKHYIGAFDPKTGELQVIEARKMIVRGAVRARQAADEAMAMPLARKVRAWLTSLFTRCLFY
jgi:DNA-directed RNA polymerase I subunit RPA49